MGGEEPFPGLGPEQNSNTTHKAPVPLGADHGVILKKKEVRVATAGDPPQQGSGRRKGARICKASPSPTQDRPRILPLQRQSQGLLQPLGQDGRRLTRSAGHCVREALPSSTRGWRFLKELEMRPESFMAGAGTNRSKLSGREPVHCP